MLQVTSGSTPDLYVSSGTALDHYWKQCQLQHGDDSKSITFSVSTTTFDVALASGGCTGGLLDRHRASDVTDRNAARVRRRLGDRRVDLRESWCVGAGNLDVLHDTHHLLAHAQSRHPEPLAYRLAAWEEQPSRTLAEHDRWCSAGPIGPVHSPAGH